MSSGFEMRVSDAERESTAAELREHYASGRLTHEELTQRLDQAFAAKTRGDLAALMRDLPSARPGAPTGAGSRPTGSPWAGQMPQGLGAGWTGGQGWGAGPGSGPGAGDHRPWGPGRTLASMIGTLVGVCVLVVAGSIIAFGPGLGGRPIGIALLIAAFALLRRLFFRRRRVHGRRPPGRW